MKKIILVLMVTIMMYADGDSGIIDLDSVQRTLERKDDLKETIEIYKYDLHQVYKVRTRVLMGTEVRLPNNEEILKVEIGDKEVFKVTKIDEELFKNRVKIKPKYAGADTSITLYGITGKVYRLYVYSINVTDRRLPNFAVYITEDGKLPDAEIVDYKTTAQKELLELRKKLEAQKKEYEDKQYRDVKALDIVNMEIDYTMEKQGDRNWLRAVINDDKFTYFIFDKDYIIPHIFYIDDMNKKHKPQTNIVDNVIEVRQVSEKWLIQLDDANKVFATKKTPHQNKKYTDRKMVTDLTKIEFFNEWRKY